MHARERVASLRLMLHSQQVIAFEKKVCLEKRKYLKSFPGRADAQLSQRSIQETDYARQPATFFGLA